MRPRTLTANILLFAAVFLIVMVASAAISSISTMSMSANVAHLSDEVIVQLYESGAFNTSATRAIREIQSIVLGGDADERDELDSALVAVQAHLDALLAVEPEADHDRDIHAIYGELNPRRQALLDELRAIAEQAQRTTALDEAEAAALFARLEGAEQVLTDLDVTTDQAIHLEQDQAIQAAAISVSQTFFSIVLGFAGLFVVMAVAVFMLRRQLTEPLDELVLANEAFAKGTLASPVSVRGQHEIGLLQIAFNRMVEMIRQQTAALVEQAQVSDRIRARAMEAEELARKLQQQNDQVASQAAALRLEVAERQQAELAMMQARDAAQAANRAKSTFLATMSHELRTPLTAIIGYSQLLARFVEAGEYGQVAGDLKMIQKAGQHLSGLINDVLDLSRIEAGKMTLTIGEVDVAQLVQQVVDTVQPLFEKNSNTLEVDCGPALGAMRTDAVKLRQVLINLLSNAAKFTHEGRVTLTVAPAAIGDQPGVSFAVADTGIGIAADQLLHLFEPFAQIDNSPMRKYGGSGLGLALSRDLCRMLGGDITVVSHYGSGSTFTATLPVASSALPASHELPALAGATSDLAGPDASQADPRMMTVGDTIALVIDDDPVVGDLLRRLLSPHAIDVVTAGSGAEGLELARDLLPDVILLDVIMAEPDGWAVLAALKADPELAGTPVIMISIDDQQQRGLALGVADYLLKPLDQQRLVAMVQRYTASQRAESGPPAGSLLVVEDDEPLCRLFQRSFEREGWQVRTAGTGAAALAAVAAGPPMAIVLDLMLPEIDGVQVIARLRANPAWRQIPIVVVTARDLSPAERAQIADSVTHILQKGDAQIADLVVDLQRLIAAAVA